MSCGHIVFTESKESKESKNPEEAKQTLEEKKAEDKRRAEEINKKLQAHLKEHNGHSFFLHEQKAECILCHFTFELEELAETAWTQFKAFGEAYALASDLQFSGLGAGDLGGKQVQADCQREHLESVSCQWHV
jgi:hypothetical protein